LYGFSTAYGFSGDGRFLGTAEACAAYYIEHAPPHGVPPNDFDEPAPALPYESSAAAIAASGLLDLARLVTHPGRAQHYRQTALQILDTLSGPEFLAYRTPGWEGALKHSIYHSRKGLGVDESVMWGDYFFLEAASKALSIEEFPWNM
jgi:unsaturated chondroitin disaccharide hydrolase